MLGFVSSERCKETWMKIICSVVVLAISCVAVVFDVVAAAAVWYFTAVLCCVYALLCVDLFDY